ncbi:MAG: tetraacyldisaccharide 4'-kinase [Candidatus Omnitrophica bacterium 4484_70.1]|nr:MAG: tetraacyldisaccharide 4'-kinase [Candidatus Omnitrophica bacterium 4484_70.1]
MVGLKIKYLRFLEKRKNLLENFFWYLLKLFSFLYLFFVETNNWLYEKGIRKSYKSKKKLINIGNIVWAGTAKTSLVIYLATKLKNKFRVACILKGYAPDEYQLVKEKAGNIFEAKNRLSLIKKLEDEFDVFILDDCFQYRKLFYNLNILMMREKDLYSFNLIPAGIYREPLKSIRRADLVVVSYVENKEFVRRRLLSLKNDLEIFFLHYKFKNFLNKEKRIVDASYFRNKDVGVLCAVGYPQGFLDTLKKEISFLRIKKFVFYPDHFQFKDKEIKKIEKRFLEEGIEDIIITYKDYYHIDFEKTSLNYFIFDVDLYIEEEELFLKKIEDVLSM